MGRFDGKAALITGAASGMGQAVAIRLASEGASVFGVDVNDAGVGRDRLTGRRRGGSNRDPAVRPAVLGRLPGGRGRLRGGFRAHRRARQHRRCLLAGPGGRRHRGEVGPHVRRERERRVLPDPGRAPPPGGVRRQHRELRLQRRDPGTGLHQPLLRHQGRGGAVDQGVGHGTGQDVGAGQRHSPRRGRHPHGPELPAGRRSRPALHPPHDRLQADERARAHRRAVRLPGLPTSAPASTAP